MTHDGPAMLNDAQACVDRVIERVGYRIVLATPVGLGKPLTLINALYRRACDDPALDLTIVTALSLVRPRASSDLERRFLEPFAERVFGDYPDPQYAVDQRAGRLPANVEVVEFYFQPGEYLGAADAQQHHISTNYTYAARDMLDRGVNVVCQLVASHPERPEHYSLSCNPDISLDFVPMLRAESGPDRPVAAIGELHPDLPYMPGDAEVPAGEFDLVLDNGERAFPLFAMPRLAVPDTDYLIGLNASALVRDGGTLQIGIGSMGDAITYALNLRHTDNAAYRELVEATGVTRTARGAVDRVGGLDAFEQGLYGASEMFVPGFLELYRSGVLARRAYADATLQRIVDERGGGEDVDLDLVDRLAAAGRIAARLDSGALAFLQRFGIFRPDIALAEDGGHLQPADGEAVANDLADPDARRAIEARCLGERLTGGTLVDAAFYLGPEPFYAGLRAMPLAERAAFNMTSVRSINRLSDQDDCLEARQRRHARFLNTGIKATLDGAVASDGLEDGRVISGVGGQYNFVAMAHELPDGRSALMVRSTRTSGGRTVSNIVWRYAHTTIPRHLKDLVVTEYGIADLRGRTDAETIAAMIEIADSRFQPELVREAKRAGKLPADYRVPEPCRRNTPERLAAILEPYRRDRGLFPEHPFGTEMTAVEQDLAAGLQLLRARAGGPRGWPALAGALWRPAGKADAAPHLERMALDRPSGLRERLQARLVRAALRLGDRA